MISYTTFTLDNGLRVVHHYTDVTPMAAVSLVVDAGAADELPDKTGLAHLIEHMMFGGSKNVPEFDSALERAGGVNNAWTSNDLTCYYDYLPVVNIETALWAESDRLMSPLFSEETFETQRKVVIEEFKQQCLNQPYGDADHLLRDLMFKVHPYRYPTIGKEIAHLEKMTRADVWEFFNRRYTPSNAVLSVVGAVGKEKMRRLAEKWFGAIPNKPTIGRNLPEEPPVADGPRRLTVERSVPQVKISIAYQMGGRKSADYIPCDLITDVLALGMSSRFEQRLIGGGDDLFTSANAFIYGSRDKGLLILTGSLLRGSDSDIAEAERRLRAEARDIAENGIKLRELTSVKNNVESTFVAGTLDIKDLSLKLGESVVRGEDYNGQLERYRAVTLDDIQQTARRIFRTENSGTLVIRPTNQTV